MLRQLLRFYFTDGELVDDEKLLDEMLSIAKGNSTENGGDDEEIIFDKYAFVRALILTMKIARTQTMLMCSEHTSQPRQRRRHVHV